MLHLSHSHCCKYWHWHNLGQIYYTSCAFSHSSCVQDGNCDVHHYSNWKEKGSRTNREIPCYSTLKQREDACYLSQKTSGSPDAWMKRAIPKCFTNNTCEEMSGMQYIYSPTCLCVCKLTLMSSAVKPKLVFLLVFFLLNFMSSKRNPGILFGWLSGFCFTKAVDKDQKSKILIHINANLMQIWCNCAPPFQPAPCPRNTSSYPKASGCSLHLGTWSAGQCITEHTRRICCKRRCPPRQFPPC